MFDVTVSVWNRFHSFPLIAGLDAAGFEVLALGTTRRQPVCRRSLTCWRSGLATQATYRLPAWREPLLEYALNSFERFATRHALDSRCLWGWNNHHLSAFQRLKAQGGTCIVECGSTHISWAERRLRAEHERNGVLAPVIEPKRKQRMLAEYALADWISVPTDFVKATFVGEGIAAGKVVVNPYGADMAFWKQAERAPRSRGPFVVVFTGQIMLRKGIAWLLEAWRAAAWPDAELWLVGGVWPDVEPLMRNLPPGVRQPGFMTHAELRALYARADAYILPSLEEGLARTILEAMAAGLPVIATPESGAQEVVRDGLDGWIIRSGEAHAIRAALEAARADREATFARGMSAQVRASGFTWESYGARAARWLSTVIGAPRGKTPAA